MTMPQLATVTADRAPSPKLSAQASVEQKNDAGRVLQRGDGLRHERDRLGIEPVRRLQPLRVVDAHGSINPTRHAHQPRRQHTDRFHQHPRRQRDNDEQQKCEALDGGALGLVHA
ncbi:hypothetical protein H010_10531 [Hydrogenophaga taeniospiralis CCUG 15921]|uniref:Uncharacterized protein n=1 Tax=Hydrogenophaga taeniospiralis CCUG 15921 TaxID=1281780 RepID=A0A9X4NWC7_9BURK|nr:hypothetical protein [Hydrogenophaga taeniospiralis CCUG 15921]